MPVKVIEYLKHCLAFNQLREGIDLLTAKEGHEILLSIAWFSYSFNTPGVIGFHNQGSSLAPAAARSSQCSIACDHKKTS